MGRAGAHGTGGPMNDTTTPSDADGVLVLSVWRKAAAGDASLVRLTLTEPGGSGDTVRVATTVAEALASIEEWLTTLTV